jgi:prepilin-type N-terminal cleavage/methylation domain-containing protein
MRTQRGFIQHHLRNMFNLCEIRKIKFLKNGAGFTLIELIVVLSIMAALLGLTSINLVRSQQTASLNSAEEVLVSDLRQQQLKSMIGDTEGSLDAGPYGIYFDSNQYVLFHGATYSQSDTSNFAVNLDSNMQFNSPDFNIIFSKMSGEITTAIVIELQDKTNAQLKKIHINNFGVVTQVESL